MAMSRDFLEMVGRTATREDSPTRALSAEEADGVRYALDQRRWQTRDLWDRLHADAAEVAAAVAEVGELWRGSPRPGAEGWDAEVRMVFAYGPRTAVVRVASAPTEPPLLRALLSGIFATGEIALGTTERLAGTLALHLLAGEGGTAQWATLHGEEYVLLGEGAIQRLGQLAREQG